MLSKEQIENIVLHYTGREGDQLADGLTISTVRGLCKQALAALGRDEDGERLDATRYAMLFQDTWQNGKGVAVFSYTRSHDDFKRLSITEANERLDTARREGR